MKKIFENGLTTAISFAIFNINDVDAATELRTLLAFTRWKHSKQYCRKRSFQEDADYMGVSKEQLSWFCKKHFGVTFLEYRKWLRVKESVRLIMNNPSMSTRELMIRVGEDDKSNFRKKFKSVTGCTPSEFKGIFGLSRFGRVR